MPASRPRSPAARRLVITTGAGVVLALCGVLLASCGDGYPPALMANTQAPLVRVLLTKAGTSPRVTVRGQAWRLDVQGRRQDGTNDLDIRLGVAGGAITVDGRPTGGSTLRLDVARSFELDGRPYPGTLRARVDDKGRLEVVDELDMETYVAGVIGNEVGPGARPATYRAQALCARTYVYEKVQEPGASARPWHVTDDTRSQVFGGMDVPAAYGITWSQMLQATSANRGVVLTARGHPIHAYYSSTCGGHTTDAKTSQLDPGPAPEVLRGVPCPWCAPSEGYASKYFRWTEDVPQARIVKGLERWGGISLPVHEVRVVEKGRGGWAATVEVVYGPNRRTKRLPGIHFRSVAGLRSHRIDTIQRQADGSFRITGGGWGHGVGMCQVGAILLGVRGATESDIVRFYYPGAVLARMY